MESESKATNNKLKTIGEAAAEEEAEEATPVTAD